MKAMKAPTQNDPPVGLCVGDALFVDSQSDQVVSWGWHHAGCAGAAGGATGLYLHYELPGNKRKIGR